MSLDHIPVVVKASVDVTSLGITVSTLFGALPHIAALLTVVWTAIRIYETETAQRFRRWIRSKVGGL